ncbi:MAG: 4-alpha-glucanotransferase [Oscillospiraceae bacterium]|nr:4-alpha-glucanotransferase [Oscillospiraceae bacterium]
MSGNRSCGVLLHITSLPSPYGIGTLGKDAEEFVDFLRDSGQNLWQVLPINPVGYGNSPYQSYSAFAGEPLLIDLDDLVANGLLTKSKCEEVDFGADPTFVDFEKVAKVKMRLLNEAFKTFSQIGTATAADVAYLAFVKEEESWLDNYALFMALKESNNQKAFTDWEDGIRSHKDDAVNKSLENPDIAERVKFWKFTQYYFRRQWDKLRRYANKNGVKIVGDIPIYASPDSADVWTHSELFQLDSTRKPLKVAGVPPDYFSQTGQLWGNPLYDWNEMKKDGYLWWLERFKNAARLFDIIRIDHFRAFDTYYAVPYGEKTAVNGKWLNGPGMDFWGVVKNDPILSDFPIIAEDLGELFDSVKELLKSTGFPGMKIMQFGFNGNCQDNEHLPHNYDKNMVVYTGTHDNSTIRGFLDSADKNCRNMAKRYINPKFLEPMHTACIRTLYASNAGTVLIPMQDILGLSDKARMNRPGTVGGSNWIWRMKKSAAKKSASKKLKLLSEVYYRQ